MGRRAAKCSLGPFTEQVARFLQHLNGEGKKRQETDHNVWALLDLNLNKLCVVTHLKPHIYTHTYI